MGVQYLDKTEQDRAEWVYSTWTRQNRTGHNGCTVPGQDRTLLLFLRTSLYLILTKCDLYIKKYIQATFKLLVPCIISRLYRRTVLNKVSKKNY